MEELVEGRLRAGVVNIFTADDSWRDDFAEGGCLGTGFRLWETHVDAVGNLWFELRLVLLPS